MNNDRANDRRKGLWEKDGVQFEHSQFKKSMISSSRDIQ